MAAVAMALLARREDENEQSSALGLLAANDDDDGGDDFIPLCCRISERDVSAGARGNAPCRLATECWSHVQVQIAAAGEPAMIEKICTVHRFR